MLGRQILQKTGRTNRCCKSCFGNLSFCFALAFHALQNFKENYSSTDPNSLTRDSRKMELQAMFRAWKDFVTIIALNFKVGKALTRNQTKCDSTPGPQPPPQTKFRSEEPEHLPEFSCNADVQSRHCFSPSKIKAKFSDPIHPQSKSRPGSDSPSRKVLFSQKKSEKSRKKYFATTHRKGREYWENLSWWCFGRLKCSSDSIHQKKWVDQHFKTHHLPTYTTTCWPSWSTAHRRRKLNERHASQEGQFTYANYQTNQELSKGGLESCDRVVEYSAHSISQPKLQQVREENSSRKVTIKQTNCWKTTYQLAVGRGSSDSTSNTRDQIYRLHLCFWMFQMKENLSLSRFRMVLKLSS